MNWPPKFTRSIIIGRGRYISSPFLYRSTMLRGFISLISIKAGILFIILDILNGIHGNFFWYGLLILLASLTFWANRLQKNLLANVLLVLYSNTIIYVFASSEGSVTGVFSFLITTGFCTLVLFGYRHRNLGFILVIATYLVGVVALSGWWPVMHVVDLPTSYVELNFLINFSIAFFVAILITNFTIQLHHDVERDFRTSEQSLILTSKELKHSRERFEMAVEGAKAGIYEINYQTPSIYLSAQYKRMLGYSDNELDNLTVQEFFNLVHPEDVGLRKQDSEKKESSHSSYQAEIRLRTKGGSYKWVLDSGVTKFDVGRSAILTVGSITDIEERKMAEQQIRVQNDMLAKANDELDRFVYSASHDLRAPLSSLLGLVMVAQKTDRQEEVAQCLTMMEQRVATMEGFIKEITDYSRNSRLGLDIKPVNIYFLIRDVVSALKFTRGADTITIQISVGDDEDFITDANRIKVVLTNLISNAIKYHDLYKEEPFIKISARMESDHFSITVEDNGSGISEEHTDKIFNMFYRASATAEGSGLGLYIVKETLNKLSGEISVHSTPGRGSVFTVKIPQVED